MPEKSETLILREKGVLARELQLRQNGFNITACLSLGKKSTVDKMVILTYLMLLKLKFTLVFTLILQILCATHIYVEKNPLFQYVCMVGL